MGQIEELRDNKDRQFLDHREQSEIRLFDGNVYGWLIKVMQHLNAKGTLDKEKMMAAVKGLEWLCSHLVHGVGVAQTEHDMALVKQFQSKQDLDCPFWVWDEEVETELKSGVETKRKKNLVVEMQ